jgi:hypothetical protein
MEKVSPSDQLKQFLGAMANRLELIYRELGWRQK